MAFLSTRSLIRIIRSGIQNAVFSWMVRGGIYNKSNFADLFTFMGVLVVVSLITEYGLEAIFTESRVVLNNAISIGILALMCYRLIASVDLKKSVPTK